ncbi:MAG: hypothetical protein V2A69_11125 [Pseudomonadota bacterium]
MTRVTLKKRLIEDIEGLPGDKIKEVINFINFLKLKEDDWFMEFVNKRGTVAEYEKKTGKKFIKIEELQEEYR